MTTFLKGERIVYFPKPIKWYPAQFEMNKPRAEELHGTVIQQVSASTVIVELDRHEGTRHVSASQLKKLITNEKSD